MVSQIDPMARPAHVRGRFRALRFPITPLTTAATTMVAGHAAIEFHPDDAHANAT
jgi:hypothetical protein